MYLLIARLRRMARPLRYSTVRTKTENETKRRAITPSTMAMVACLMTEKEEEGITLLVHTEYLKNKQTNKTWQIKEEKLTLI